MSNTKAVLILQLCLFAFFYLTTIDCRRMPVTRRMMSYNRRNPPQLPKDFMERGKSLLKNIQIPNSDFCTDMILRPEDQYLVLPWWYNYCQDLKEKNAKGYRGNLHYTAIHKYILDELQLYKKRLKQKTLKLSELEMELQAML